MMMCISGEKFFTRKGGDLIKRETLKWQDSNKVVNCKKLVSLVR